MGSSEHTQQEGEEEREEGMQAFAAASTGNTSSRSHRGRQDIWFEGVMNADYGLEFLGLGLRPKWVN